MAGQRTCQRRSSRAVPRKMQEPPKSIEEFLKFQNWVLTENWNDMGNF
ncbi:FAM227B isoform 10 [Pongo abelii]|uniref:FAM227B isoform 10 n=1 Tax=Pongo abelii TaxID=9601 RepID=A0A2J8VBE7_PONAB|nr:FAM227B isoform 10 [Pongo abelii]